MAENKTQPTKTSVLDYIQAVEHQQRREDALKLLDLFSQVTQEKPVLWGDSLIGFGSYTYQTADKKTHQFLRTGFSPRKQNLALYIMPGFTNYADKMQRLGKYKTGKSCLYINKLSDVDESILKELIKLSVEDMASRYPD
ncbi:DUF1801 domain-containing protein [Paraglaciecola aestuariivivens]